MISGTKEELLVETMSVSESSLLFLGTGSSAGVPVIGCNCSTCTSTDPKNHRTRTSVLLSLDDKLILIDAGPDIRYQTIRAGITTLDALFLTHTHYDHVGGVEELRIFNFKKKQKLPCYLSQSSMDSFKKLFYYHFTDKSQITNYTAEFEFHVLKDREGSFDIFGERVDYISYSQGGMDVLGFRVRNLAYITDIKEYSESIFNRLQGLDTLIVSAQRFTPSTIQFTFDEAVAFAERVNAKNSYFTHLSHDIDYQHADTLLRQGMHLAYDGLKIPIH